MTVLRLVPRPRGAWRSAIKKLTHYSHSQILDQAMRRMTARRMVVSGLVLAIALAARPARSAEKAPNERLLPPRTYAYVTVPSVGELKTRFDKSLTGRLLKDPKLADFLGDVHKKFAEFADEFQKHVGVKIDDVL